MNLHNRVAHDAETYLIAIAQTEWGCLQVSWFELVFAEELFSILDKADQHNHG
jgi:hypothetical protein